MTNTKWIEKLSDTGLRFVEFADEIARSSLSCAARYARRAKSGTSSRMNAGPNMRPRSMMARVKQFSKCERDTK